VTPHADAIRKRELALIHIGKAHLGYSREDYEYLLRELTGKTSAAAMDAAQRDVVLKRFKLLGFTVKAKPASGMPLRDPQHRKLRAMWYALADVKAVARPAHAIACDQAIEVWAKRQINDGQHRLELGQLDALRFATAQQLRKLIEDLKSWAERVDAPPERASGGLLG